MFRHVLCFACLFLLLHITIGLSIDYRCGANGCLNGVACQNNGKCKCGTDQYGTHCDTRKDCGSHNCNAANTIANTVTATATHTCYNSFTADKCVCKDGYTGDDCADEILKVECKSPHMKITIKPHRYADLTDFTGKVYFASTKSAFDNLGAIKPACIKGPTNIELDTSTATADCLQPIQNSNLETYFAYIKHSDKIISVEDQIIEIVCDTSTKTSVSITNSVIESSKEVQKTTVSEVDDVIMKIRKDGGNTLDDFQVHDTVKVNDNIALTLESTSNFLIRSCEINDGVSPTPAKIDLIKDWCVDKAGLLVYSSNAVAIDKKPANTAAKYTPHGLTPDTNAVKLPLKAVKFTTGSKMMFTCELCKKLDCKTNPGPGYKVCTKNLHIGSDLKDYQAAMNTAIIANRRKRSVTNGTVGTSISVSLTVDEYKELLQEANESKETECFKSAVVLLPLILLASLLVIAMGMTFFFCNKFTQNMTEGQSNIGFKA